MITAVLGLLAIVGVPLFVVIAVGALWGYHESGIDLLCVSPDQLVARIAPSVKSNNRQANVMAHRFAWAQASAPRFRVTHMRIAPTRHRAPPSSFRPQMKA